MKKFAVCYQASFQELKHVKTLTTAAMLMAVSVVLGYFTIEAGPYLKIGFGGASGFLKSIVPYFRAFSAFSVTATNFMNSITFVMNYLFLISSDFSDFASLSDPQTLPFFFKRVPPWFYLRR